MVPWNWTLISSFSLLMLCSLFQHFPWKCNTQPLGLRFSVSHRTHSCQFSMYILLPESKLSELKYHLTFPTVTCKFQVVFSLTFADTVYHEIRRQQTLLANQNNFCDNIQFPQDKSLPFLSKCETVLIQIINESFSGKNVAPKTCFSKNWQQSWRSITDRKKMKLFS